MPHLVPSNLCSIKLSTKVCVIVLAVHSYQIMSGVYSRAYFDSESVIKDSVSGRAKVMCVHDTLI